MRGGPRLHRTDGVREGRHSRVNNNLALSILIKATNQASGVINQVSNSVARLSSKADQLNQVGGALARVSAASVAASAALAVPLYSAVSAAAGLQEHLNHVGVAMDEIGTEKVQHLEAVKKQAQALAQATGIAAEASADAYYIERSNMLNHAQAMAATVTATKLAIATTGDLREAQEQLQPTARLLTAVFNDYGDKTKDAKAQMQELSAQIAKLQTQYAFKNIGEVQYAYNYALPVARGAGVGFSDMNAALALISSSGLYGAEAGTAFEELVMKLQSDKKLLPFAARNASGGIDVGASLQRLTNKFGGMPPAMRELMLSQLGFAERSGKGLALLMDRMKDYGKIKADISSTPLNFVDDKAAERMRTFDASMARLSQAVATLKQRLGDLLLPAVTSLAGKLASVVRAVDDMVKAHPRITKFVLTFAALSAGALALVAAVAAAGAAAAYLGAGLAVVAGTIGIAIPPLGLAVLAIGGLIAVVAALAAFAPGALSAVAHAFEWLGNAIWGLLSGKLLNAGIDMMVQLAKGIAAGIPHVVGAAWKAAKAIADHFVGHSPPPLGPLHEIANNHLMETLAGSLHENPVISAAKRIARALVLSVPMVAAPAYAFGGSAIGGAGATVTNISFAPTINLRVGEGADAKELKRACREAMLESIDDLDRRLKSLHATQARTRF